MRTVFYFVLYSSQYVENYITSHSVTAAGPGNFVLTQICVYIFECVRCLHVELWCTQKTDTTVTSFSLKASASCQLA